MKHRTLCKHIFCMGWGQNVKSFCLSESGHVEYQIKGNEVKSNMQAKCSTDPLFWAKHDIVLI